MVHAHLDDSPDKQSCMTYISLIRSAVHAAEKTRNHVQQSMDAVSRFLYEISRVINNENNANNMGQHHGNMNHMGPGHPNNVHAANMAAANQQQ